MSRHDRQTTGDSPTLLKALLREKHLQEHRAFCREYDRIASTIDRSLVGSQPSKATFYRWLSGELQGLPYPDHCRILEKMLPGWTAQQLFEPSGGAAAALVSGGHAAGRQADGDRLAGLSSVYTTRSEFAHHLPPHVLFDEATSLDAAGLSLNFVCQQYADAQLRGLLGRAAVRLLFLDPHGEAIKHRSHEEKHEAGHLEAFTIANINVVRRIRDALDEESAERVSLRTYDETVRFNIMLVDQRVCVMQPYLPGARGLDSPTFVSERRSGDGDLYSVFDSVFTSLWDKGKPL